MDLLFMNVDLLTITSELGYVNDGVYAADENCGENLTAMLDMIDNDDTSGSTRQQLGAASVFSTDLMPLLDQKIEDDDIYDSLIRLVTKMTDPVIFPSNPDGPTKIDIYNKKMIENSMIEYKNGFDSATLWVKLRKKIVLFLKNEITKASPELAGISLNFVRNILSIDDPNPSPVSVILYADSGMARLIQYISAADNLGEWHLHAIEIYSGLLRDTAPKKISKIYSQQDALSLSNFNNPCCSIEDCNIEYSPVMDDRKMLAKPQDETIFLHYYFSSISQYCSEEIVKSLVSKVNTVQNDNKIAVAQICIWFINFISLFDSDRLDLNGIENLETWGKISRIFSMGITLSIIHVGNSDNLLVETFTHRSIDLLAITTKFNKSGQTPKLVLSEEVVELMEAFVSTKIIKLFKEANTLLHHFLLDLLGKMLTTLRQEFPQKMIKLLQDVRIVDEVLRFLGNTNVKEVEFEVAESILIILSTCKQSIEEVTIGNVFRLVFANTAKIQYTELNAFQIKLFQHVKTLANTEKELIKTCQTLANNDAVLMEDMALLFQFGYESEPKRAKISEPYQPTAIELYESLKLTSSDHEKALVWILERITTQMDGTELNNDVVLVGTTYIDQLSTNYFGRFLKMLGFIKLNGQFMLKKGHISTDLKAVIEKISPAVKNRTVILTARSIAPELSETKRKKKRGISKNKKLGKIPIQTSQVDARDPIAIF